MSTDWLLILRERPPAEELPPPAGRALLGALLGQVGLPLLAAALLAALLAVALKPLYVAGHDVGQVLAIRELLAREPPGGRLLFGSSQLKEGVDCRAIRARLGDGRSCWNLALSGGSAPDLLFFARQVAAVRPARVVFTTGYLLLSPGGALPAERAELYAAEGDDATLDELRGLLEEAAREPLQRPRWQARLEVARTLPGKVLTLLGLNYLPPGGTDLFRQADREAPWRYTYVLTAAEIEGLIRPGEPRFLPDAWLAGDFSPANPYAQMLGRALLRLAGAGIETEILVMPLHPRLRPAIDQHWPAQPARFLATLAQVGAPTGTKVVDWLNDFGADDFADLVHLNAQGRARLSARLADHFRP